MACHSSWPLYAYDKVHSYATPMAYGREPHVEIPVICPPPSAVREVYVNDLPEWATDGWLREQFESAGDIVKAAKVMEHGIDGKPYGYVQIEESPLGCLLVPNGVSKTVLVAKT